MSNITKLPKDTVQLAQLRLSLSVARTKFRILAKKNLLLKAEKRDLKKKNTSLNQEIVNLNEKAALVPTLQEEVKHLAAELEKCRRSKKHSGGSPSGDPHTAWMG